MSFENKNKTFFRHLKQGGELKRKTAAKGPASDIAIGVQNLSKCFMIYDRPRDRLKQSLYPRLQSYIGTTVKKYHREFWAIKDVSFDIKKGETVGIIGRNGSGKSTLLQLICGTLAPTLGAVETRGRIGALLELGSGFNPEFTGHENIYINGAVIGLTKKEIDLRYDDIVAFADIGQFIDQPVTSYSSGMFVRLAFAVSIMADPQIMVVDEALSVGDMNFQAKCMTALTRIQEGGATILFVSHDIGSVKSLCSRGIYLERGKVAAVGPAAEVAEQYIRTMREEMNEENRDFSKVSTTFSDVTRKNRIQLPISSGPEYKNYEKFADKVAPFRYGTGEVRAAFAELADLNDEPITIVEFNQKVKARVFFEAYAAKTVSVNINFMDANKTNITGCNFRLLGHPYLTAKPGEKFVAEYVLRLPLREGNYSIQVLISTPVIPDQTAEFVDVVDDAVVFSVNRWTRARLWSKVYLFPQLTLLRLDE